VRNVRKNYNVFVDGRGYAGQTEDFTAPKLTLKTEEFQGGGMFSPMDITMGAEKLECGFTLLSSDPYILGSFSVVEGTQSQISVREVLESQDGTQTPQIHTIRGKVKEIDPGESKPGEKATTKVTVGCSYYKLTQGALVIHEIDVPNMVWIRNGVDMLAGTRAILGI
jgi:uncharacterized protein